ncbi:DUF1080 domain-containing protein [Ferruginibacter sp.]|uniref:3-keto-disaccharide hydrolase n=1 Tax=Ferruginibacter sp. TaxID=1940288 RepID=UPI00198B0EB3|nr:DUF1080 domain-containing protein [Ferruginibacter sp.]MBC7628763.1 DUF1080 domain-containing protein [Ferruginibacter sp.]
MKKGITGCLLLACFFVQAQKQTKNLKPLFNGKNLNGWYSFLTSKGKNSDPEKVFNIENGLLHISGKEFGYICTEKVYNNFHLVVEFKWGTKKYPPRDADTTRRDNGILYFVPQNATDFVWPKSIECQIQEGDVGDFWMVDSTTIVVDGVRTIPKDFNRAQKKADGEKPTGEWNRVEVIANNGNLTHIVNGITVNKATGASLSKGKIIIQSEGAEIYYRKIEIAVLK